MIEAKSTLFEQGYELAEEGSLEEVLKVFNEQIEGKFATSDIAGYFWVSADPARTLLSRVTKAQNNVLPALIGKVSFNNGQGLINMPQGSIVSIKKK